MTPGQQRIAIAELMGIKVTGYRHEEPFGWQGGQIVYVPDYLNDLNACAEFERNIPRDEWNAYINALEDVVFGDELDRVQPDWDFRFCTATAPQRCEAFLRAKGKWED